MYLVDKRNEQEWKIGVPQRNRSAFKTCHHMWNHCLGALNQAEYTTCRYPVRSNWDQLLTTVEFKVGPHLLGWCKRIYISQTLQLTLIKWKRESLGETANIKAKSVQNTR